LEKEGVGNTVKKTLKSNEEQESTLPFTDMGTIGAQEMEQLWKAVKCVGQGIVEAALDAMRLRFRRILMTACSTLLGMVPLVIASGAGAAGRRALGTAVFDGLVAATVLVVFFAPPF
jgi:Cu/Ag efflux pump CusA